MVIIQDHTTFALDAGDSDVFAMMNQDCTKQSQNFSFVEVEGMPDVYNIYCQDKLLVVQEEDYEIENWKRVVLVTPESIEDKFLAMWKIETIWDGQEIYTLTNGYWHLTMDVLWGSEEIGAVVGVHPLNQNPSQQCKLKRPPAFLEVETFFSIFSLFSQLCSRFLRGKGGRQPYRLP